MRCDAGSQDLAIRASRSERCTFCPRRRERPGAPYLPTGATCREDRFLHRGGFKRSGENSWRREVGSMKNRREGSALIEFAFSLIVVSALFTGIFQFSYSLSTYHALVNAVRAGARYASLQPRPSNGANPDFTKAVQNVVVYGDPVPLPNAKPVAPGLMPESV